MSAGSAKRTGWHPLCPGCVRMDHETVATHDEELACVQCGARSAYLAIDSREYDALSRVTVTGPTEENPPHCAKCGGVGRLVESRLGREWIRRDWIHRDGPGSPDCIIFERRGVEP